MKKRLSLLLSGLCLLCLLAGCTAGSTDENTLAEVPGANGIEGSDYADILQSEDVSVDTAMQEKAETGMSQPMYLPQGRKIILTAYLELESESYEDSYAKVVAAADKAGGYVSASNHMGGGMRRCELTLRIPVNAYADFMSGIGDAAQLLSKEETSEDVTDAYIDIEARLKALKTQEASLLALMEKAETLEDILTLEERLSDVRYEIESYTVRKRAYDDQTQYSTVHLALQEVKKARGPEEPSFGSRVSDAFAACWKGVQEGVQEAVIGLIYLLPVLVVLLIIAGAVTAAVFGARRKRKNKLQAPQAGNTDEHKE